MISRRAILQSGLATSAALIARARMAAAQPSAGHGPAHPARALPVGSGTLTKGLVVEGESYTPVVQPNGWTLPFEKKNGWKVFHLVAEPVAHEIAPGLEHEAWGYNGSTPGPLIELVEGDKFRVYVTNKLAEPTSVHWHGMLVPNGMDGLAGLTQPAIPPGKTFKYEFPIVKPGTFMYHPHIDELTQISQGMMGMIVVHPKRQPKLGRRVRDYALLTGEWEFRIGTARANPLAMTEFNVFTFNSMSFPATEPLVAELGDLVRIRLGNLNPQDHHPIHIHGYAFEVTETDGGQVPKSARVPETTILVPVGSVRVVEFIADAPGDWAFHCHMLHHVMNQMGHEAANLIGANVDGLDARIGRIVPGYMTMGNKGMADMMNMQLPKNSISMVGGKGPFGLIDMGGMFTIIKVRKKLTGDKDPGWYNHPQGEVASDATDEFARAGLKTWRKT
jgi:FtsP/CotA-like multicopper oxidase with cupredoxin domain